MDYPVRTEDVTLKIDHLDEICRMLTEVVEKASKYNIPGMVTLGMFQHYSNYISRDIYRNQMEEAKKRGEDSNG